MNILLRVTGLLALLIAGYLMFLALANNFGVTERVALFAIAGLLIWIAIRIQRRATQSPPIT